MTWEIFFACGLTLFALISFMLEKIPTDLTAMSLLGAILLVSLISESPHLPSLSETLEVFSNPAPLTIAAMFIISAALEKCGVIDAIASYLQTFSRFGYRGLLLILLLTVTIASAFINNTAVVVVLLPVVLTLARSIKTPASKLLIPLSYASIFGGCCTAIGTSTNILVSSILEKNNFPPLSMFELAAVGVPIMILGITYLVIFGKKLLPIRESLTSILSEEERKEYIIEAFVNRGSELINLPLKKTEFFNSQGIRVLELVRDSIALETSLAEVILQEGDRLVLACHPSAVMKARSTEGINVTDQMGLGLEQIAAHEASIVEGIVGPTSSLIGKTIREVNFRQHFRTVLMAVHRRGANLREKLGILRFEFGDTLLLMGTEHAVENLRNHDDILLLDKPAIPAEDMRAKIPIAVGILVGIVLCASFNILPIVAAAIIGVTLIFLTRCLKPKDGYDAVEWRILILIYGMLALGLCLEKSGVIQLVSDNLVAISNLYLPEAYKPYFLLFAIYLCTGLLTEVLSNNATAVLMAPIALGLGTSLGVDPRPFVLATAIAASASFSTPIGYQTNTYVYGVGCYKFSDFWKIGLPLNLLYLIGCTLLIPYIWKF